MKSRKLQWDSKEKKLRIYGNKSRKMYSCKTKKKTDNVKLDPREVVRTEVIKMANMSNMDITYQY
jgi:hypothetical protein